MDPVFLLRASFLLAAAAIVVVRYVPMLQSRFLAYGSREKGQQNPSGTDWLHDMLNRIAAFRVPHSWFTSFYVASTIFSIFWAPQMILNEGLVKAIAASVRTTDASMTPHQITTAWMLMAVQGCRRLYESLEFSRPSSARMWIGHWALGIWFYASMSIAVWVEGSTTILTQPYEIMHFVWDAPSARTFISTLIFILASGIQHDCHAYLASLKKYSLPKHPVFSRLVCPHYTAECLIYLALSLVAAPPGNMMNWTIFCAFIFVAANLGVTADGTKEWYEHKFGKESVANKWRMMPLIF